jgi:hypothetical protein
VRVNLVIWASSHLVIDLGLVSGDEPTALPTKMSK